MRFIVRRTFSRPVDDDYSTSGLCGLPSRGWGCPRRCKRIRIHRQDRSDWTCVQGYGYITYIAGIPEDQMFTDPSNHTESTARFTWASTATMTARSVVDNIFMLNAAGSTTFYYNETPAGDFSNPASFTSGTAIAVSSERWQNVVNVQSPDTAIAVGGSQFTEISNTPFMLNGVEYQIGHTNLLLRFAYTGEGHRSDRILPSSNFVIAGNAVVGAGS
ncbi:MAG: hypothetical protein U0670_03790 [Anaerolineae bacterium]